MLYLGPHEFATQLLQAKPYTNSIARAARAHLHLLISTIPKIQKNTKNLHHHVISKITKNQKNQKNTKNPTLSVETQHTDPTLLLAEIPSFQFIPVITHLFQDPDQAFARGIFRPIHADSIDLPPPRPPVHPNNSRRWTRTLPPFLQEVFSNGSQHLFIDALKVFIAAEKANGTLPKPRIYATTSEYAKLLHKVEEAGMLHWNVVSREEESYAALANDIEMTLFAVSKSETRNRLISWPRIQNDGLPDPPYTSLPDPSLFQALQINGAQPSAFYLDIANMFHNIVLPLWLAELFPMKPIKLRMLKSETIKRIKSRPSLRNLDLDQLVRPLPATMPMGFKWSVFVGHTFSKYCLLQAFEIFKSSRFAPEGLATLQVMQREQMPLLISKETPLLMLIIDDVAGLTVDWPHEAVSAWYRISRNMLTMNLLPIAHHKSCPIDHVELHNVDFIGCQLMLQSNKVFPMHQKLEKLMQQLQVLLSAQTVRKQDWDRIIGKTVWIAMLNRPLLACLQRVFREGPNLEQHQCLQVTPQSKRELRMIAALLPLAQVHLHLPLSHLIVAFDASNTAGAVTYARVKPQDAEELWHQAQSEKFNPPPPPPRNLPAVQKILQDYKWKKAFIHNWRKSEHIDGLESATAVLALEWLTRSRIRNARVLMLSDSQVTIGALNKGRSSSQMMLVRCRRFAAILLANNIQVTMAYVESKHNPFDRYTRLSQL